MRHVHPDCCGSSLPHVYVGCFRLHNLLRTLIAHFGSHVGAETFLSWLVFPFFVKMEYLLKMSCLKPKPTLFLKAMYPGLMQLA